MQACILEMRIHSTMRNAYVYDFPSVVQGISLVDITATGVTRGNSKERNQQRNWETVQQTVGILTQISILQAPKMQIVDLKFFNNNNITIGSKHRFNLEFMRPSMPIWSFVIGSEHTEIFGKDNERIMEVFDLIPIISGLDESITLDPCVFHTSNSELVNIQFMF